MDVRVEVQDNKEIFRSRHRNPSRCAMAFCRLLVLIRHFFRLARPASPTTVGKWGSALRATPQATMGEVYRWPGPTDNLYVHVPTVSSLAGLADRLLTWAIAGLGLDTVDSDIEAT